MPFGKNPWWVYVASFVPALLVTILIFMDQQISAVIVNRKENKLKVGILHPDDAFNGITVGSSGVQIQRLGLNGSAIKLQKEPKHSGRSDCRLKVMRKVYINSLC